MSVGDDTAALGPLAALLADPSTTALLTDFDGTLSPIVDDPDEARPLPAAPGILARLSRHFAAVAVVSGRPVAFLATHLAGAGPSVRLYGVYGLEWREGGQVRVAPEAEAWLAPAAEVAAAARRRGPSRCGRGGPRGRPWPSTGAGPPRRGPGPRSSPGAGPNGPVSCSSRAGRPSSSGHRSPSTRVGWSSGWSPGMHGALLRRGRRR
jgi:hypothetical protein